MSLLHPGFWSPCGQGEVVGGGAGYSKEKLEDEQTENGQEAAGLGVTGANRACDPQGQADGGRKREEECFGTAVVTAVKRLK